MGYINMHIVYILYENFVHKYINIFFLCTAFLYGSNCSLISNNNILQSLIPPKPTFAQLWYSRISFQFNFTWVFLKRSIYLAVCRSIIAFPLIFVILRCYWECRTWTIYFLILVIKIICSHIHKLFSLSESKVQ